MEVHECESKGVRATGCESGKKFVVLKGSFAVGDSRVQASLAEKPKRVRMRAELISTGKLIVDGSRYRFADDVEFNSPSEAASIVWGSNLNGRKVFGIEEAGSVPVVPQSFVWYYEVDDPRAIEGYRKDKILSVVERDRQVVNARKQLDDYKCQACGARITVNGKYVIECHHLNPVALGERVTTIDDLVSLCPTCHRIAHMREPPFAVADIRRFNKPNNAMESDAVVAALPGAAHG